MKHIKTPVALCKRGSGRLFSDVLDDNGDYVAYEIDSGRAAELVQALNDYDAQLTRIAELEEQVEALVEACETGLVTLNVQPCNNGPTIRHAQWVFRAALALVRGEEGQ